MSICALAGEEEDAMEQLEQLLQRLRIASPKTDLVLYAKPDSYVAQLANGDGAVGGEIQHPRLRECIGEVSVRIRGIIEKKIAALEMSAETAGRDLKRAKEALAEITPPVSPPPPPAPSQER